MIETYWWKCNDSQVLYKRIGPNRRNTEADIHEKATDSKA